MELGSVSCCTFGFIMKGASTTEERRRPALIRAGSMGHDSALIEPFAGGFEPESSTSVPASMLSLINSCIDRDAQIKGGKFTEALAFIEERAEVAAVERLLKEAEDHFRRLVKVHAAELATAQAKAADSAETHEAQRALMTSYNNLAQVSAERGQKEDAMRTLKKVLATLEELPGYGKKHKDTLRCRTNLGTLLSELAVEGADATARAAAFDEADQVLTAASKGLAETLGPAHTSTVTTLHNLGYMLYNRARSDDLKEDRAGAEKLLARSERLFQQTYEGWAGLKGAGHADAVQALTHAAGCAVLLGKPVEGRTALEAWIHEHGAAADAVARGIVERALAGVTARIAVEDTQKKQGRMQ